MNARLARYIIRENRSASVLVTRARSTYEVAKAAREHVHGSPYAVMLAALSRAALRDAELAMARRNRPAFPCIVTVPS